MFPVVDGQGVLCGLAVAEALRVVVSNPDVGELAVVADVMSSPRSVRVAPRA